MKPGLTGVLQALPAQGPGAHAASIQGAQIAGVKDKRCPALWVSPNRRGWEPRTQALG